VLLAAESGSHVVLLGGGKLLMAAPARSRLSTRSLASTPIMSEDRRDD
jgi:hypothetical protein